MKNQYKVRTIVCKGCGNTVTKRMPKGRNYCSLECFRASKRPQRRTGQTVSCGVCNRTFYVRKHRLGQEQYFCSKEHANEWQGRNKISYTCKICGDVFKWSPSRAKENPTYCSIECRDKDPQRREMLIQMNATQQKGKQTKPETIGYSILDSLGIAYKPQHLIGEKFCVDAFVPSTDVVVQFDGDYWHGHPERFPEPDHRQRKRMKLDYSQDAYMRACGYSVIRIWECDLKRHPEAVTAQLRQLLALPEHAPAAPA